MVTEEAGKKKRATGSRSRGGCNTCRYAGRKPSLGTIYPTAILLHIKLISIVVTTSMIFEALRFVDKTFILT
jgi:hypothetical protein